MAATYLSVARLLQLRVAIAWQEAVAVVSAADARSAAEATPITLEDCHISLEGQVRLVAGPGASKGKEVSALQLLRALLEEHPAPEELRALIATADDALASFPSEGGAAGGAPVPLHVFLSPQPEAEIARLAARGLAAEGKPESASTPRLAETAPRPLVRTQPRVPIQPVRTHRRPTATERGSRRILTIGFVLVLLATASGVAIGALVGVGWLGGGSAAPETTSEPPAPVPRARVRPDGAANDPIASRPLTPLTGLVTPSSPSDVLEEAPVEGLNPNPRIYSSQDDEVEPPVLLSPQMPERPRGEGPHSTSELELLIDERGVVQRVRLDGVSPSLHDRMIVSAAKAWQFRPAVRDGQPVRYVLRLPVTR